MAEGLAQMPRHCYKQKFYTFVSSKTKGCLARLPARQPIYLAAYWAAGWLAIASSMNF